MLDMQIRNIQSEQTRVAAYANQYFRKDYCKEEGLDYAFVLMDTAEGDLWYQPNIQSVTGAKNTQSLNKLFFEWAKREVYIAFPFGSITGNVFVPLNLISNHVLGWDFWAWAATGYYQAAIKSLNIYDGEFDAEKANKTFAAIEGMLSFAESGYAPREIISILNR